MTRIWRLALAGALALCAAALVPSLVEDANTARADDGKRVALVIGNSTYPIKPLPSPVKDAAQWATSLEAAGFDVDQCLDCKLQQMKDKLAAFKAKIAPGDEAFFYYGGHGAEENDLNLLFPVDADIQGCGTLFEQSITLSYVLDVMAKAKVRVVVLDACRSSPFPTCTMDNDPSVYGPQEMPNGTLIAYATRRGDTAADTGQGSAYSRAVLPLAFQPGRPLYDALIEAAPEVQEATGGKQEPWVLSSLSPASYALRPGGSPVLYGTSTSTAGSQSPSTSPSAVHPEISSPPLGKLGDPPAGGPTGRTYVARKGTAGEMSFVGLSEGVFDMGSPEGVGESSEHPQRRVRVSGFAIGQSEVTQAQWAAVVRAAQNSIDTDAKGLKMAPATNKRASLPVESVSWCDAARFANVLSRLEGKRPAYTMGSGCEQAGDGDVPWDRTADGYRLPTAAEWEYAARAGTTTAYFFGDDPEQLCNYANIYDQSEIKWYTDPPWPPSDCNDGQTKTAPVCTYPTSTWGLCDLYGNVWEWTWDWYEDAYNPADVSDPSGPEYGIVRTVRGGSWAFPLPLTRSATRNHRPPPLVGSDLGFRLVLPTPASEP